MTYAEYISSDAWRIRRGQRLKKDRQRCQGCGSGDSLHVHHRCYDRLGNELPEDIITVCEICHGFIHQEQERTGRALDVVTDAVLALVRASGPSRATVRDEAAHTPRHVREPSGWRSDSRGPGTWARGIPERDEVAAARRANGLC
jgi:phage terminase large subunit GpA-like protein